MRLRFGKYEGLGNDFVVLDTSVRGNEAAVRLAPSQAIALCDRHRGIGADGVLIVGSRPSMLVINADGSVPEMCGNGLRCVALHLARTGRADDRPFEIDTGAGKHTCRVLSAGEDGIVEVAMRPSTLEPHALPVIATGPVIDQPFEVLGRVLHVTALSMGNPHAVIFDEVGEARFELGPALGRDERFPQGVNVGFARRLGGERLELHVFERGAGWTQACGTGACAAAAAAVATGRARRGVPLQVNLPGGTLEITVAEPGEPVLMTGPARHVFEGEIDV